MKLTLISFAALALAAVSRAQELNENSTVADIVEPACTKACAPYVDLFTNKCTPLLNDEDDEKLFEGIVCYCDKSFSDLLLSCTGCLSNHTMGAYLVDSWNEFCPSLTSDNSTTNLTYVQGTAAPSSSQATTATLIQSTSAAGATPTGKDSGAVRQVPTGGLALLLAAGLALLA